MSEREGGDYSREAYDQAEQEVETAKGKVSPEAPTDESRGAVEERAQAEEKRAGLYEMAWDEALELNKQYDELWTQKEQTEQALADFRKEKLGMGEEKEAAETEKKEPTLEEWAGVLAEINGEDQGKILEALQSLQSEMSEDERKELTMPFYVKEGMTTKSAWQKIKAENPTYEWINPGKIKTQGETGKAEVGFGRFSQEADEDSLGGQARPAEDWEKTDQKFMSPKQAMIAREAFRRLTGKQMDGKNMTMCPGSRSGLGNVPRLFFYPFPVHRGVYLGDVSPGSRGSRLGVRRVVSRELES